MSDLTHWIAHLQKVSPSYHKAVLLGIYGAGGGAIGSLVGELVPRNPLGFESITRSMVLVGIWFGIIGVCIAVALLAGHLFYLKRSLLIAQATRDGAWFGFLAGGVAGAVAQGTYAGIGPTEVLRVLCWGIAGGLLGYALSFRIPNLGAQRGLGGGAVGGVVGGCLFIFFGFTMGGTVGRLLGVAAIGFCIGLMIILAEALLREAWLEVSYGPNEKRTVSLGREPVSIGGDAKACTIYAHHAPSVAVRYKLEEGQILCEDVVAHHTVRVMPGHRQAIGHLTVTVCAAVQWTQPSPSPMPCVPQQARGFALRLSSIRTIPMQEGARLSGKDIPGLEAQASDGVVAEVVHNPQDPTILGLKNRSHGAWVATVSQTLRRQVEPGKSLKLVVGTTINFGAIEGEIIQKE